MNGTQNQEHLNSNQPSVNNLSKIDHTPLRNQTNIASVTDDELFADEEKSVLTHATNYHAAELSLIPIRTDGSKAPALKKGQPQLYDKRLPTSTLR